MWTTGVQGFDTLPYCGWKKSCTTFDGWTPINNGINHQSTGAGFLPPTVCFHEIGFHGFVFHGLSHGLVHQNSTIIRCSAPCWGPSRCVWPRSLWGNRTWTDELHCNHGRCHDFRVVDFLVDINHSKYRYIYYKPKFLELCSPTLPWFSWCIFWYQPVLYLSSIYLLYTQKLEL